MARWQDELDLSNVAPELLKAYAEVNAKIEQLNRQYGRKMPAEARELLHTLLGKRVELLRKFGTLKVKN